MKNILKVSLLILSIFLTSCSSDDDGDNSSSISDNLLSGMVHGEVFTATSGISFASGDDVSINITNSTKNCDDYLSDYDVYVSTKVPAEVGTYENTNVVFQKDGESPLNFLAGTVIVEEITSTSVTVKIKAISNSENTVEGKFTVNYCE